MFAMVLAGLRVFRRPIRFAFILKKIKNKMDDLSSFALRNILKVGTRYLVPRPSPMF